MASKPDEFIEHFLIDDNYVTDIWYHPATGMHSSVLTDMFDLEFKMLDDIRVAITKIIKGELTND